MFLTLLIVTRAVAEWVEIPQQHYRKPMHTYHSIHNPFTTPNKMEVEETTQSWTYNKSVSEYDWKKGSKIQSNDGNLNRVQLKGALKSAEPVHIQAHQYSDYDGNEFDHRTNYGPTRPTVDLSDNVKQKGIIEKVPNIGSVKRVSLSNTPIKSPVENIQGDRETAAKNRYEELPLNNEQRIHVPNKVLDTKSNKRRIYVNNLRDRINNEHPNAFPKDEEEIFTTEAQVLRRQPNPELTDDITLRKRFQNFDQNKRPGVTEKKNIFTTPATNVDESTIIKHNKNLYQQSTDESESRDKIKELSKHQPSNKVPQTEHKENHIEIINNDQKIFKNGDQEEINVNSGGENEINDLNIEQKHSKNISQGGQKVIPSKETKPENKIGSMENLLKIMKVVADTISQNTRRSFGGKMKYLHELKDTILDNIAGRIDATWPDDDVGVPHRRARSAQTKSRGHHVQFPSSESALMTISFLTFAVFLIKLVLQIIHTYKNKTMMVAPLMVSASGRTVFTHHGHH
ncbi:unnamed protein product [Arctia plantaginis]|uniref:Uncharacterized protein n=1 Tax=Arctia plantaginis TaxID=874455 RepID=A0A8S1AU66_ARCPL|nr:unnamed protein product [Arctia plantaginis]